MTCHSSCSLLLLLFAVVGVAAASELTREDQKKFEALLKEVQRHAGGYVHPSIGLVAPAPSGAPRGIALVKKVKDKNDDLLMKIPYSYQLTRPLALETLSELIPPGVFFALFSEELDDAALLVLLLAHEYGLGSKSKFAAYIQTLPVPNGGCGWADVQDVRNLPKGVEMEDVEGALNYAHRVSNGMAKDYASYLAQSAWPKAWKDDPAKALDWALCIVSSRATAANAQPGDSSASGVRLVPLADMANHQVVSGGFLELKGNERLANGDFLNADIDHDAGAFVVRSTWKDGKTKELALGEEILVNYNLPDYSPADWFLSLGFVPPELMARRGDEF